jgi:hypothetical protein
MAQDLAHDAAFHTNGRLGMLFAQTEIVVYEVKELSGNVEVEDTVTGTVCATPVIGCP